MHVEARFRAYRWEKMASPDPRMEVDEQLVQRQEAQALIANSQSIADEKEVL